ncbi:hypothetical protein [Delftia sp. GW456-R20]|uniref:hypothetical protein n=1 Tax=Delftia sp. GW456-R20 TaxID=1827145 RepID=UPI000A79C937|nr:hypothetical protein [Delftia sp. GW456-R20]
MPKGRSDNAVRVKFPEKFTVSTPKNNLKGKLFEWEPDGIHIEFTPEAAEIHYMGERSDESGIKFEIPASPEFLRTLAKELDSKATELEKLQEGRSGPKR